ncbi:MAG: hypothetical protein IKD11_03465, partial [Oscillospiraceae bacterium]|nr:hypothetical protein [Oscillospiraceae bacterium]
MKNCVKYGCFSGCIFVMRLFYGKCGAAHSFFALRKNRAKGGGKYGYDKRRIRQAGGGIFPEIADGE